MWRVIFILSLLALDVGAFFRAAAKHAFEEARTK
jgi:hypothetical protein